MDAGGPGDLRLTSNRRFHSQKKARLLSLAVFVFLPHPGLNVRLIGRTPLAEGLYSMLSAFCHQKNHKTLGFQGFERF